MNTNPRPGVNMAKIAVSAVVDDLRDGDPVDGIIGAHELHQELLDMVANCATVRRTHIRALRAAGWSGREIGDACGISHQRVYQLESGADRKEKG